MANRAPVIQNIRLSKGEVRLTWPGTMTELKGADIRSDLAVICLGTEDEPGDTPVTPDVITASQITVANYIWQGGTNPFNLAPNALLTQLAVSQLVGGSGVTPDTGSYWVWARLPDQSEIEWFRFHKVTIT